MSRHHRRLHRKRWEATREAVLERDGYRCTTCGRYGNEVDHINPLERQPQQDPFDWNGLQTLCRSCHIQKTRKENRRPPTPAERRWMSLLEQRLSQ